MTHDENPQNIFIYHYIEELISNYGTFYESNLKEQNMTVKEFSILLRIRINEISTQHDLVEVFKVSGAYIAKVLKKFEENEYIIREEYPENRRKKIIKLTKKGIKKTDELIKIIDEWEKEVTSNLTEDEIRTFKELFNKITWK